MWKVLTALGFAGLFASPAYAQTVACPELTAAEQFGANVGGYIGSPGVLYFLGAIAVVGGLMFLLSRIINFDWMSANAWGFVGCVFSAAMVSYAFWAPGAMASVLPVSVATFVGALAFAPFLALLLKDMEGPAFGYYAILVAVYVPAAIVLGSAPIGFLAVIALFAMLGFTAFGGGLSYCIGFESEDRIPGTTIVAIVMAGIFTMLRFYDISVPWLAVFESGAFWVATFVAGIGVLITSSKWYRGWGSDESKRAMPYVLRQIGSLGLFAAGLYAGVAINDGTLLYITAAFAMLYIVEKLYELSPQNGIWYGVLTTGLGVLAIYGGNWLSNNMDTVQTVIASMRA